MPADPKKKRPGFSYLTIDEFVKLFKGHGYDKTGERYWAADCPGLRVIGLDACLPEEKSKWGAVMPEKQMAWLDRQLSDNKDQLNLIMIHHNLIPWSAKLTGGPKQWFTIDNAPRSGNCLPDMPNQRPCSHAGKIQSFGCHLVARHSVCTKKRIQRYPGPVTLRK